MQRNGKGGRDGHQTGRGQERTVPHPHPPAREVEGKDKGETNEGKVGSQRNRTVTNHPPGKEDGRKERRKREEGKAGADQNRTDQNKGKNEDTTREHRKRTEGKPENSMVGKSADCLTLSFFHI